YQEVVPKESAIVSDLFGQNTKIKAEVINFPKIVESGQRAYIKSGKHKILAYLPLYPEVSYGDSIIVSGKIEKPESFKTDTGRIFDYVGYLAKDGVGYVLRANKIEIIGSGEGTALVLRLFSLKKAWISKINEVLPGDDGALLSGILLGQKVLDKKKEDNFRVVGLSHIIVLSGYNIAIVIFGVKSLFRNFGKKKKLILSAIFAILFTIMVSSGASTLRATLMALSVMFADMFGRLVSPQRALFVAIFFMILHNPLILFYDPGFLLSFLATFGIIYFSKPLAGKFFYLDKLPSFKEILSTSLSAQMFVLPYIIYLSGQIPVFSPLTNILVLPTLPPLMALGALGVLISFVGIFLALPFILLSKMILFYILEVVEIFSGLGIASVKFISISPTIIFIIYSCMIGGTILWHQKRVSKKLETLLGVNTQVG
ncbi:MAG: ComEC/Rec2 family competence protein, partial [Patescibacteria group bacterium]